MSKLKKVIAKDGRTMHPNSMANMDDKSHGFQEHPENRITNGATKPDKLFRKELLEILYKPVSKKDKRTQMLAICQKIVDTLLSTTQEQHVKALSELLIGSIDGNIKDNQPITNAITAQNVILLPPQMDKSLGGNVAKSEETPEITSFEIIEETKEK